MMSSNEGGLLNRVSKVIGFSERGEIQWIHNGGAIDISKVSLVISF